MQKHTLHRHSDLFTLRLWLETLDEWQGLVEHVISGEAQYFRDWPTLIAFLKKSRSGSSDRRSGLCGAEGDGTSLKGPEGNEEEA